SAFLCPSAGRTVSEIGYTFDYPASLTVSKGGVTDYLFNGGAGNYATPPHFNAARRGPGGFHPAARFSQVTLRRSQTCLLGEAVGGNTATTRVAEGGIGGKPRVCTTLSQYGADTGGGTIYYDNLMYQAYGRSHPAAGGGTFVGGLLAKTTDANGAFYAPNDCGGATFSDDVWAYETAPGAWPATGGQRVPNFRSAHP